VIWRPRLAFAALIAGLAAATLAPAQEAETPALPKAPIPYNQLGRPRVTPVPQKKAEELAPKVPEKPAEPLKRARAGAAILQGLDKVTAQSMRFEAKVGQPVRYKGLVITVRACETAAPDELAPEASAYVIVDSAPRKRPGRSDLPGRQIFRGWMYASSPGLNPLQHPAYDAWLIACKAAAPSPAKR
jgi:hypothetical protein